MLKLLVLKGLPASGKSTYAKMLADKGWVRVNKDDLRMMANNGKWSKGNESLIIDYRDAIIRSSLNRSRDVVVDDTNLHPSHPQVLQAIALDCGADYQEKFFDITVEEAIKRDLNRPVSVGSRVIKRFYRDYLAPRTVAPAYDTNLPPAIIVDIDGTLAHMVGRSPYDPSGYANDKVDSTIRGLVNDQARQGVQVLVVSGRDDTYKEVTRKWLQDNGVTFDQLFMRPMALEPPAPMPKRKDYIVKKGIYNANIRGKYNIKFVLDDRDQVVQGWRELGLKCLQVAEGDF